MNANQIKTKLLEKYQELKKLNIVTNNSIVLDFYQNEKKNYQAQR